MKGRVIDLAGYGCRVFGNDKVIFFESKHDLCEEHQFKE